MHVIADDKGAATNALEVRGRPTVMVLRPDGLEVTRLSGDAELLALKLPPYLALAAGPPGAGTMPATATGPAVAPDELALRAARDLRTARTLLEENHPNEALAFLDRDAGALTASQDAQMLRARPSCNSNAARMPSLSWTVCRLVPTRPRSWRSFVGRR